MTREVRTRLLNGQAQSLTTEQIYDAKGQVIESKAPDGGVNKTVYNSFGKPEQVTDAQGRITRMEYDARGMDKKTIYPDQSFEESTYDLEGNVVAKRDREGHVTKMVYDAANRLTETILPDLTPAIDTDNPRQITKYSTAGEVEWQQDERGNKSYVKYDLAGRSVESKDALSHVMTTVYDAAGQRTSMTDALGRTTKFIYDTAGRMRETVLPDETPATDADNPRMRMEFDAAGRKIVATDEAGRVTRYSFDKLGRLLAVVLPNPSTGANPPLVDGASPANSGTLVTRYEYDEQGNKTAQIDAEGRRTEWAYDVVGRNISRKLPLGQIESFVYNTAGERTQHTSFNGVDTLFAYDGQGRMDKVTFPNNRLRKFTYTTDGKVQSINDGGQNYTFEYDERDRLTKATDSYGRDIQYQYDLVGNRTQLKTAKQEINYSFDELNRLSEVVTSTNAANVGWAANQQATYQYDEVGNRKGMVNPNGTVVNYGFDVRNRLKTLVHKASTAASATVLLSLSYTVDASGLRTQIAETRPGATVGAQPITRTSDYLYDSVKRLTRETVSGVTQNRSSVWTYDRVGNRLSEITSGTVNKNIRYVYDANDRLSKETDSSNNTLADYVYDQNGNTIQKKLGTNILASYRWDEENRMVGATIGAKVISYAYDPSGIRRSQEEVEGAVRKRTEYVVDSNQSYAQVVEEWGAYGAAASSLSDEILGKTYVFGDDLISQTKVALDGTGTHSFYHYDGLGTTRALSDANGAITDRNAYMAFGENDPAGTSGNTSGTTDNNFKYTGEQLDPNLGFYYLRARYMKPSAGGFVSMESYLGSSQDPTTLHKFIYANANPVMGIDPSGNATTIMEAGATTNGTGILASLATAFSNAARIYRALRLVHSGINVVSSAGTASQAVSLVDGRLGTRTFPQALEIARSCMRSGGFDSQDCSLTMSTLILGDTFPIHREIVTVAMSLGAPMTLTRREPPLGRGWLRCPGSVLYDNLDCDEYPYASTHQGGPNGLSYFSLNTPADNRGAGALLLGMYNLCGVKGNQTMGDQFFVMPLNKGLNIPTVPICGRNSNK